MVEKIDMILGGAQGAGLETTTQILSSAFASSGLGVLSDREYYSNIKGRHSYVHAEVSSGTVPRSLNSKIDLLGCMDAETLFTHFLDLKEESYLVYDVSISEKKQEKIKSFEDPLRERLEKKFDELGLEGTIDSIVRFLEEEKNVTIIDLDFPSILAELQDQYEISSSQASRYVSSILIGAVSGLMDLETKSVKQGVNDKFEDKQKIAEQNIFLIENVVKQVKEKVGTPLKMDDPSLEKDKKMMVNGNQVTGMGKIVAGLRFQSYYPITPAADESFFLEENAGESEEENILVFQTEDEIAAITSCIGAALTGTRSATATSGPGFALMVEGLGWAGMNEVPIVITYYQRGGPSTGLPTRGSQEDLTNALFSSHGDFPRIVLASGDHGEAFLDAVESFNLAEKYQTPVIHLLDKYLANFTKTTDIPDLERIKIERGKKAEDTDIKRFADGPISPRISLGDEVIWNTGSEHSPKGHVMEDPENRIKMHEKRMDKLELADKNMEMPERVKYYGPEDPEYLLVGWGSVKGPALDSLESLDERIGYLHLRVFSPFPSEEVLSYLEKADKIISLEHSYSVKISRVIRMETGISIDNEVVKFTGRPMYRDEFIEALKNIIEAGSQREVLRHGP